MNVLIFLVSQVAECQHRRSSPTPGPGPGHSLSQRAAPPSDTGRKMGHINILYFIIISLHYYYSIITGSSTIGNSWWYNHSIIHNTTVPVYGDQVYQFLREPSLHFHHPHRPESGTGQISETASAYKPKSTLYRSYLKPVVLKNIQIINLITCKWLKWR